ncbi:hypothetical protein HG531_004264 [Fusarium graminearum]|nr:hypothetical protein HG531_004264 [Fusarium graminearum]
MRRYRFVVLLLFLGTQRLVAFLLLLDPPDLLRQVALRSFSLFGGPSVVVLSGLVPLYHLNFLNIDFSAFDLSRDRFALTRILVEGLSVHLEGREQRRDLNLAAFERGNLLLDQFAGNMFIGPLGENATNSVVAIGGGAKHNGGLDKNSGSERIESSSMANLDLGSPLESLATSRLPAILVHALCDF